MITKEELIELFIKSWHYNKREDGERLFFIIKIDEIYYEEFEFDENVVYNSECSCYANSWNIPEFEFDTFDEAYVFFTDEMINYTKRHKKTERKHLYFMVWNEQAQDGEPFYSVEMIPDLMKIRKETINDIIN